MSDYNEVEQMQLAELEQSPNRVHVKNPRAYQAFRDGKVVCGLRSEAEEIRIFRESINAEFHSAIVERPPSSGWPFISLYHKHASQERIFASESMQKVFEENPELRDWRF